MALLVSLSQQTSSGDRSASFRRVQYFKELSIDNKRMYCGLHGYTLVIAEDLHHARDTSWDKVRLLAMKLQEYEWLLWLPIDALFADAASSLDALTDEARAHLVVVQVSSK